MTIAPSPPALLFPLLLAAASGAAAEGAGAPLPIVRDCLAAADASGGRACIGRYTGTCIAESPEGETTVGIIACTYAEAEAWDRLLNEIFGELVALSRERAVAEGPPAAEREDLLRAAQRAWLAFRDADCRHAVAQWGAGSMARIAGADCTLERTASRVLELRARRAALEEP